MILEIYKKEFESFLVLAISEMGPESVLKNAVEYALESGGKRLRPILVMIIAKALGGACVKRAALSVEYFHTASLIADDLPCMDDDAERRGKPSLHVVFGESVALLASYTLIAQGYGSIYESAKILKQSPKLEPSADARAMICLNAVTQSAGLNGATMGQFLDLFPPEPSFANLKTLIEKKTGTLFEIAFVFGWVFGGGELNQLLNVKKCAQHLGFAFQIVDDFEDDKQDEKANRGINIVNFLGQSQATELFFQEINAFQQELKFLKLFTPAFQEIVSALIFKVNLKRESNSSSGRFEEKDLTPFKINTR